MMCVSDTYVNRQGLWSQPLVLVLPSASSLTLGKSCILSVTVFLRGMRKMRTMTEGFGAP